MITVLPIHSVEPASNVRISTKIRGFDNLLKGGLMKSGTYYLAGQPGAGKSTLLSQLANNVANEGKVLYISAEESTGQARLRANNLRTLNSNFLITDCKDSQNDIKGYGVAVEDVIRIIKELRPLLVIVDSLQMLFSRSIKGDPGSQKQETSCLYELNALAKDQNVILMVIGHSTKGNTFAGLLKLQHIVDTTIFLAKGEGNIRTLEIPKSRFSSNDTKLTLEMTNQGLRELDNYLDLTAITNSVSDMKSELNEITWLSVLKFIVKYTLLAVVIIFGSMIGILKAICLPKRK